ncbi:MAG: YfhO family protein [Anaerovoracaceae bacterium]|jgi:uncharacterized membrane protein YfhO
MNRIGSGIGNKGLRKRLRGIWPYVFFAVSVLTVVLMLTQDQYYYGSSLDWNVQHTVIPDHLRQMFYDTGVLFPQFDPNTGGGQNIYFLAYYGYLSPVIMFSYLLPWVSMRTYIECAAVISVIASVCLVYKWIRSKTDFKSAMFAALMFEFAVPLIFHSHRQIMFMIYMPFLVLAFIGADRYLNGKSPLLLMISVFLTIMTSFYFSVGGIIALAFYLIIEYIRIREENGLKIGTADMLKKAVGAASALVTGMMTAGILIIPELDAIKGNRMENNASYSLADLLIPDPAEAGPFYRSSAMGVTAAFAVAFIVCIISSKHWMRFLGILLAVISCENIVVYALNGGMYLDGKVLIPFLPLAAYAFAAFAAKLRTGTFNLIATIAVSAGFCVLLVIRSDESWMPKLFVVDMAFTLVVIVLARYSGDRNGALAVMVLVAALVSFSANADDDLVSKYDFKDEDLHIEKELSAYAQSIDGSLYRTGNLYNSADTVNRIMDEGYLSSTNYLSVSNSEYLSFSSDALYADERSRNSMIKYQSKSLLMNLFMGNKYMISDSCPGAGYYQVAESDGVSLWKNSYAWPLAYVTHSTMSTSDYNQLNRAEKAAALMTHAVFDDVETTSDAPAAEKIDTSSFYDFVDTTGGKINATKISDDEYELQITASQREAVKFKKAIKNKILLVSMKVDNGTPRTGSTADMTGSSSGDVEITVNGIKNKLSNPTWKYYNNNQLFEYVISSDDPIKSINIDFGKGNYKISDFQVYTIDIDDIISARDSIQEFEQKTDSSGDAVYPADLKNGVILEGTVSSNGDGYFMTTIPYDDNFTFYVDGKETDYYLTDGAFMGFPVSGGTHTIKAVYHNSTVDAGAAVSAAGVALMVIWASVHAVRARKKKKGLEGE